MSDLYNFRERAARSPQAPILFLFHGTGGDENQFFDLGAQLRPEARLIAVRGDVSEGGALRYFRRTGEGVYDMDDLGRRTEALAGFVAAQIGDRAPSAVLGLGYSNGANILASVQFAHPKLFDATVLMHPLIPFTLPQADLTDRRVLITAGRRDRMCPAPLTNSLADSFSANGADLTLHWHDGGHEIRPDELAAAQAFLSS